MRTPARLGGFTLIEVLIVIAIIGLLVGLLVPAVNFALRAVQKRAIAMEVNTLAGAVEKYRQKYNDYPPDGSSGTVIQRHLLKLFPNIASSELALLSGDTFPGTQIQLVNNFGSGSSIGVMDPAEALVFFLGGFSDDAVYPISGVGGPIFITDANGAQVTSNTPPAMRGSVQYNALRNSPLYEFKESSLTLDQSSGLTVSNDEGLLLGSGQANDLLPVYRPTGKQAPYVYFDHRSYSVPVGGGTFFNHYTTPNQGAARPYRSTSLRTTSPATPANADAYYRYMNDDSFQLISAGLDDLYGGIPYDPSSGAGGPVFYRFPTGESINFAPYPNAAPTIGEYTNYADGSSFSTQLDNATNFSDGVLEDALEN